LAGSHGLILLNRRLLFPPAGGPPALADSAGYLVALYVA
jgi:hypothetical protein